MQDALQRFYARVDQSGGPDACHPWLGYVGCKTGYGEIKVAGKKYNSHRYLAMLLGWDIDGKDVRHFVCHNKLCCNERHLAVGTRAENMHDSWVVGRFPVPSIGSRNGNAKLNEAKVQQIRERGKKEHVDALAVCFNVSRQCIVNVLNGRAWAHV